MSSGTSPFLGRRFDIALISESSSSLISASFCSIATLTAFASNAVDVGFVLCESSCSPAVGASWRSAARAMAVESFAVFFFLFVQKDVAYFTKFGPIIQ